MNVHLNVSLIHVVMSLSTKKRLVRRHWAGVGILVYHVYLSKIVLSTLMNKCNVLEPYIAVFLLYIYWLHN